MAFRDDALWMKRFQEFKEFVCRERKVPAASSPNEEAARIGVWFIAQRNAYRAGTLPGNRISILDDFFPGWHVSRVELAEAKERLFLVLDWEKRVPEGEFPVDFVVSEEDIYVCLKNGIYSCEGLLTCPSKKFQLEEAQRAAFDFLFPNLDYNCSMLLLGMRNVQRIFDREMKGQFSKDDVEFLKEVSCNSEFESAKDMRSKVSELIGLIGSDSPMYKDVLCMHYGLDGAAPCNIGELSKKFGIRSDRLMLLESKAFEQLEAISVSNYDALYKGLSVSEFRKSDFVEKKQEPSIVDIREMDIETLDLSKRSLNALHRSGLHSVGDILEKANFDSNRPFAFLSKLPGFGGIGVSEVVDKMNVVLKVYDNQLSGQKNSFSILDNPNSFREAFPNLDYNCAKFLALVSGEEHLEFLTELSCSYRNFSVEEMREQVNQVLAHSFSNQNYLCLSFYFGLDGSAPMEFDSVGKLLEMPGDEVQYIVDSIIANLKQKDYWEPLKKGLSIDEYQKEKKIAYVDSLYERVSKYAEKLGYDILPIEEFGFSTVTYNALRRAGFVNAVDVLDAIDFTCEAPYLGLFCTCRLDVDGKREVAEKFDGKKPLFGRVYYPDVDNIVEDLIVGAQERVDSNFVCDRDRVREMV